MIQNGYFLISVKKSITLLLWADTAEELEPDCNKEGRSIVPYYKDGNKEYLKIDNKLVRIS